MAGPLLTPRRAAAGALAGLLAGGVLHLVLLATGADGAVAVATPLGSTNALLLANLASSVVLGVVFAMLPVTGPLSRGVVWGVPFGFATWLLLDHLVVRSWAGRALDLGADEALGLGGRLLWGGVLGALFVVLVLALFRAREVRGAAT